MEIAPTKREVILAVILGFFLSLPMHFGFAFDKIGMYVTAIWGVIGWCFLSLFYILLKRYIPGNDDEKPL